MARTYARIDVKRGNDDDWRALTLPQKAVYDFLLTNPKLSTCGALDVKLAVWCRYSPELDVDTLTALLEDLETAGMIAWDRDTDELLIRTFVRHDGVLQNRNLGRGMWAAWESIESDMLRSVLVDNLPTEAWEPRFQPPILAVQKRKQNHRSEPRFEPPSEPPHPHPQPHPASFIRGRSNETAAVAAVDNQPTGFATRLAAREQIHCTPLNGTPT